MREAGVRQDPQLCVTALLTTGHHGTAHGIRTSTLNLRILKMAFLSGTGDLEEGQRAPALGVVMS